MGAWDHTTFGNDDACDWSGDLSAHDDLGFVEETLDRAIGVGSARLEAPMASQAIAAAEVVARLQGHFGFRNATTEVVDEWVAEHPSEVPASLVLKAHAALDRVLNRPSELLELWENSGDWESWREAVTELRERIEG